MSQYALHLIIFACAYALVAASVSISMGFAGLFSVAQAALYGSGAYAAALLAIHLHVGVLLSTLGGAAVAALVSVLTALPALRLKAEYLVVGSLALQLVASTIFSQTEPLGANNGLTNIPVATLLGKPLTIGQYCIFAIVVVAVAFALFQGIMGSPWGRIVRALRDDEVALRATGKNILVVKVWVLAISGALAGVGGSLYANYVRYISPDSFTIHISIIFLAVALIGGSTQVFGSIVGAVLLVGLPELIRLITLPPNVQGQLQQLIYGALLVLFMMFRPQGIIGRGRRRAQVRAPRPEPTPEAATGIGGHA